VHNLRFLAHVSPKDRAYFAVKKQKKKKKQNIIPEAMIILIKLAISWSIPLHDKKLRILFDIKLFQNYEAY